MYRLILATHTLAPHSIKNYNYNLESTAACTLSTRAYVSYDGMRCMSPSSCHRHNLRSQPQDQTAFEQLRILEPENALSLQWLGRVSTIRKMQPSRKRLSHLVHSTRFAYIIAHTRRHRLPRCYFICARLQSSALRLKLGGAQGRESTTTTSPLLTAHLFLAKILQRPRVPYKRATQATASWLNKAFSNLLEATLLSSSIEL